MWSLLSTSDRLSGVFFYRASFNGVRIAVVIPTLDEVDQITGAVQSARGPRIETWVVDGGSRDGTVERARNLGARVISSGPGRAVQLQAGFERVSADAVVFLHADTRLPEGFDREIISALAQPETVGGAFRFGFDRSEGLGLRVVEAGARLRSFLGWPYGDQALFVRRSVLEALGGVPQAVWMEDLDLVWLLRQHGRFVCLGSSVKTSARRYREHGVIPTVLRNAIAVAGWCVGADRQRICGWRVR